MASLIFEVVAGRLFVFSFPSDVIVLGRFLAAFRRRPLVYSLSVGAAFLILVGALDYNVARNTSARITQDLSRVEPTDVALVLGTTPGSKQRPNRFFSHRMDAAAELYQSGKVKALLVSGTHSSKHYNETLAMEDALVDRGIPREAITRDEAGLRTLDSMVRAKKIFGLSKVLVVSQRFHVERALFLADHHALEARGYATKDVGFWDHTVVRFREVLARTRATIDVVIGTQPRFLGKKEKIRFLPKT